MQAEPELFFEVSKTLFIFCPGPVEIEISRGGMSSNNCPAFIVAKYVEWRPRDCRQEGVCVPVWAVDVWKSEGWNITEDVLLGQADNLYI